MTLYIIIITVILSFVAFQNANFFERTLFRPYLMRQNNEWWRWVTSGFIHKDYGHLFMNMFVLYFFSGYVEAAFAQITGSENGIMYLVFYLSAIVVSGMFDYHRYQNEYSYSALGASGAVAAVVMAYIVFNPFGSIYLYFFIKLPAWLFGLLYILYEYYMGKKQMDNIGHNAHLFGSIYGLIFPLLIYPQSGLNFIQAFVDFFK